MKVEIKIILNQDELFDYCKCMYDENGYFPTFEEVGKIHIEQFIADHSDYIDKDSITAVLNAKGEEITLVGNVTQQKETKLQKSCDHIWEHVGTYLVDPDAWYYNQPTHHAVYSCPKCGAKKEEGIN